MPVAQYVWFYNFEGTHLKRASPLTKARASPQPLPLFCGKMLFLVFSLSSSPKHDEIGKGIDATSRLYLYVNKKKPTVFFTCYNTATENRLRKKAFEAADNSSGFFRPPVFKNSRAQAPWQRYRYRACFTQGFLPVTSSRQKPLRISQRFYKNTGCAFSSGYKEKTS